MEYRIVIQDRKDYYEATSYRKREMESGPWIKLGKPAEGSLEDTVLHSALRIAHDYKKKRTEVIIKL